MNRLKRHDQIDFILLCVLGIFVVQICQFCEPKKAFSKEKIKIYEMKTEYIYGRAPDMISLPESLSSYYYYDNDTGKIVWSEDYNTKKEGKKK